MIRSFSPDPNDQHLDALASGYDSVEHARAAARERREAAREDDEEANLREDWELEDNFGGAFGIGFADEPTQKP